MPIEIEHVIMVFKDLKPVKNLAVVLLHNEIT